MFGWSTALLVAVVVRTDRRAWPCSPSCRTGGLPSLAEAKPLLFRLTKPITHAGSAFEPDLRGIPATPAEVEAFVGDTSPDYYEKYVDQLLKTEQAAEHRARYWLDYARYADTHGIHFDNYREMWSYREWLVNAFITNQSFDQFTIDSLAGDLRPNRTVEQQVGSGFNRCLMTTIEGGIIDEEYLVLYARDRTETTSQVWLGLTTKCCVCHDHKFDPISQKEFYQLAAFFNNTTQIAKDGNVLDTPPIINVSEARGSR